MEFVNNNSNMEEYVQGFTRHTMENMEIEEGNIEGANIEG